MKQSDIKDIETLVESLKTKTVSEVKETFKSIMERDLNHLERQISNINDQIKWAEALAPLNVIELMAKGGSIAVKEVENPNYSRLRAEVNGQPIFDMPSKELQPGKHRITVIVEPITEES